MNTGTHGTTGAADRRRHLRAVAEGEAGPPSTAVTADEIPDPYVALDEVEHTLRTLSSASARNVVASGPLVDQAMAAVGRARAAFDQAFDEGDAEVDPRMPPADLRRFIDDFVAGLAPDVRARIRTDGPPVGARLDPRLADQILAHLVDDLLRHTSSGVVIRTRAEPGAAVLEVDDAGALDTGRGVHGLGDAGSSLSAIGSGETGLGAVALMARMLGAAVTFEDTPEGRPSFEVTFRSA